MYDVDSPAADQSSLCVWVCFDELFNFLKIAIKSIFSQSATHDQCSPGSLTPLQLQTGAQYANRSVSEVNSVVITSLLAFLKMNMPPCTGSPLAPAMSSLPASAWNSGE